MMQGTTGDEQSTSRRENAAKLLVFVGGALHSAFEVVKVVSDIGRARLIPRGMHALMHRCCQHWRILI